MNHQPMRRRTFPRNKHNGCQQQPDVNQRRFTRKQHPFPWGLPERLPELQREFRREVWRTDNGAVCFCQIDISGEEIRRPQEHHQHLTTEPPAPVERAHDASVDEPRQHRNHVQPDCHDQSGVVSIKQRQFAPPQYQPHSRRWADLKGMPRKRANQYQCRQQRIHACFLRRPPQQRRSRCQQRRKQASPTAKQILGKAITQRDHQQAAKEREQSQRKLTIAKESRRNIQEDVIQRWVGRVCVGSIDQRRLIRRIC